MADITDKTKISLGVMLALVMALLGAALSYGKASSAQGYAEKQGDGNAADIRDIRDRLARVETNDSNLRVEVKALIEDMKEWMRRHP